MKSILKNNTFRLYSFIIMITLLYGLTFILCEFYNSPFNSIKDFFILTSQWLVICTATFGLISAFTLNKYIFTICFPLNNIICTTLTYFKYTANISLTPSIIDLALVNDFRTNIDVVSWQLILLIIISLIISVTFIYYRWKFIKIDNGYLHIIISIFIILLTNSWVKRFVNPVKNRMPYSVFYNLKSYINEKQIVSEGRDTFNFIKANNTTDSLTVVMVLGESLRSDHLQLNGYKRNTTPLLSEDSAVISIPNIYTEPCYTHTSIPHILTRADSIHPELAFKEQSFISIFKKTGFYTAWLANQAAVETFVYFMNEGDTLIHVNNGGSLYNFTEWSDKSLLPYYKDILQLNKPKQLIVLHTIGSHWWYNTRYPKEYELYKPTIKSRVVSSCTKEEMINSYDNTILYTDTILYALKEQLKDKNAILIYLSDHGEALGEDGNYLHGSDYPILHNPACFVWFSDTYAKTYSNKISNLKENRFKSYRTDFLFHSIIDAGCIETEVLDNSLSIFQ